MAVEFRLMTLLVGMNSSERPRHPRSAGTRGVARAVMLLCIAALGGAAGKADALPYVFTGLGTLGGSAGVGSSINASGPVAGYSTTSGNAAYRATLWNGTTATDLNSFLSAADVNAGWVLSQAFGINDGGWTTGNAYNTSTGEGHAFLLTPVPEPQAYALALASMSVLSVAAQRRRSRQPKQAASRC